MAKSAIVSPFKVCLRTGLRTIKNENKTAIMVTHDISDPMFQISMTVLNYK